MSLKYEPSSEPLYILHETVKHGLHGEQQRLVRSTGPPNHHDEKVDLDQLVVNKEISLWDQPPPPFESDSRLPHKIYSGLLNYRKSKSREFEGVFCSVN